MITDKRYKNLSTLTKRADFLRLQNSKRKWITSSYILLILPKKQDNTQDDIRVGYTVTKKVGNSPERSRIKRRLKELTRLHLSQHGKKDFDYLFIGRANAKHENFATMVKNLEKGLIFLDAHNSKVKDKTKNKNPNHKAKAKSKPNPNPKATT